MYMSTIAALVMAAGRSSRMGQGRHKLLLPLGDRSVLARVLDTILASGARPVFVVLGYQAEQLRASLAAYTVQPEVTLMENPDYQQGMSTSLCQGIAHIMALPQPTDGVLMLLGDQPLMTPQILDAMIALKKETSKRIIIAHYNGKRGNPTLFDASLFPELLQMVGDEGGRKLIERYPHEVASLEMDDPIPTYDVDTWEMYQQVAGLWEGQA